ncbi:MAG: hypothetical protein V4443_04040 [Pseudomonadota bacterium]
MAKIPDRNLEQSLAEDGPPLRAAFGRPWAIAAGAGLVIAGVVFLSLMLSRPDDTELHKLAGSEQSAQITQEQINAMVEGLAQKLKTRPDDGPGWAMLGRSYATLRRFTDASMAYQRAVALMPNNSSLLTEYADVLAMTNGRNVQGEPERIVQQALLIDPNNIKAMALAATAAFQRQDYPGAIIWWQKIIQLVPPDSPVARSISANISQAQGMAHGTSSPKSVRSAERASAEMMPPR